MKMYFFLNRIEGCRIHPERTKTNETREKTVDSLLDSLKRIDPRPTAVSRSL